ncbi:hypothetical protein H4219_004733, partial [Mycoemilia scoparia]
YILKMFSGFNNTSLASTATPSLTITGASNNTNTTSTGGFGFGSTGAAGGGGSGTSTSTGGSLFGSSVSTSKPANSSFSLFGSNTSANTNTATSASGTTGLGGGLFGSTSASTGAAPTTSTSGGSLFGSSTTNTGFGNTTNTTNATGGAIPSLTAGTSVPQNLSRKSKYVDLPEQLRKTLLDIENTKKQIITTGEQLKDSSGVQMEKTIKQVNKEINIQKQNLSIVKRAMGQDLQQIGQVKDQVNECLRDMERAVSVISQAVDSPYGGGNSQGPTPLLVALEQLHQHQLLKQQQQDAGIDNSNANNLTSFDIQAMKDKGLSAMLLDPAELSRRVQMVLLNSDITTEYFWKWMNQVEVKLQMLDSRICELQKHVDSVLSHHEMNHNSNNGGGSDSGSYGSQSMYSAGSSGAANNPKIITDVMRNQYTTFMALAGKLAGIKEDANRLKQKLGIRDQNQQQNQSYQQLKLQQQHLQKVTNSMNNIF